MAEPQNNYPQTPGTGPYQNQLDVSGAVPAGYDPSQVSEFQAPQNDPYPGESPQYGYSQPQQPQYGYNQPQYNYNQPQQPQYGYGQPQYNYNQPQQPQYGGYGYNPTYPVQPANLGHRKAIGSMVLMIIALVMLSAPFIYFLPKLIDLLDSMRAGEAKTIYTLEIVGSIILLIASIMMLVSAIIGSRSFATFGIGTLLLLAYVFFVHFYRLIDRIDYLNDTGKALFYLGITAMMGILLAGIGILTRIKGLKIAGAIVMLNAFVAISFCYIENNYFLHFMEDEARAMEILGMTFSILLSVAVLCFPLRRKID